MSLLTRAAIAAALTNAASVERIVDNALELAEHEGRMSALAEVSNALSSIGPAMPTGQPVRALTSVAQDIADALNQVLTHTAGHDSVESRRRDTLGRAQVLAAALSELLRLDGCSSAPVDVAMRLRAW